MQYNIYRMDLSAVYKAFNLFASMCLLLSSCGLRMTSSFPTTGDPLYSPSEDSFSSMEEDDVLRNHQELELHVESLQMLFNSVFDGYKSSRFGIHTQTSCLRTFTIAGLPQHHRLTDPIELRESDLLTTHESFVQRYISVMNAVIIDEYLYEGEDSFVHDRDESFLTIKNFFERLGVLLREQLHLENLVESGITLFTMDKFHFEAENLESTRNLRVLCVLEDIHQYLPMLLQHSALLKRLDH